MSSSSSRSSSREKRRQRKATKTSKFHAAPPSIPGLKEVLDPVSVGNVPDETQTLSLSAAGRLTVPQILQASVKFGPIAACTVTKEGLSCTATVVFMERAGYEAALSAFMSADIEGVKVVSEACVPTRIPVVPYYIEVAHLNEKELSEKHPNLPIVRVNLKLEPVKRVLMDKVAAYVVKYGKQFELGIAAREVDNPCFGFLRTPYTSKEHTYYKWRLYSMLRGDTLQKWRTAPFQMFLGGAVWIPPPCTGEFLPQLSRLNDAKREELFGVLRGMDSAVGSVRDAMIFCLDNAKFAGDIVHILYDSMSLYGTPWRVRVSRLYVLSDVLFNASSSAPHAAGFTSHIEERLPFVIKFFKESVKSLSTEEADLCVKAVLEVMTEWRRYVIIFKNVETKQFFFFKKKIPKIIINTGGMCSQRTSFLVWSGLLTPLRSRQPDFLGDSGSKNGFKKNASFFPFSHFPLFPSSPPPSLPPFTQKNSRKKTQNVHPLWN